MTGQFNDFHDLHRSPYPCGVRARQTAGQVIANTTWVTVIYEIEDWDPTSSYNPATGVYTAPHNGVYWVTAGVLFELSNTLTCAEPVYLAVYVNAGLAFYVRRKDWWNTGGATFFPQASGSCLVLATKGQAIEVKVRQHSGGNLSINAGSQYNNYLMILRRGPYNP